MKSIKRIIILALVLLWLPMVGAAGLDTTPRRIEITASKFSYKPSAITLKKGEPVVLVLTSTDVTHGLVVKDLGVKVELKKDQTQEVPITPDKVGTFQGKCSHFCGKGHGSMILNITVVD